MTPSQIRSYSRNYGYQNDESTDIFELIQSIPTLTKIGAICLVLGKCFGIMAIPAAFIPALNILVFPLIFAWGSLVVISIVLCSVDHFKKKKLENSKEKLETATAMIHAAPELHDQILHELDQEEVESAVIIPLAVGQR